MEKQFSDNFFWYELTRSKTADEQGIANVPGDQDVINATRLVLSVCQPLRTKLNRRLVVLSWFRSVKLNGALKPWSSKTSDHLTGSAQDMYCPGVAPIDLARVAKSLKLPFKQVIVYKNFIHISVDAVAVVPRRQVLIRDGVKSYRDFSNSQLPKVA